MILVKMKQTAKTYLSERKHGIRANGGKEHLAQQLATYLEEQAALSTLRTTRPTSQSFKRRFVDQELATEDEAADPKVSSTDVPVSRRTRSGHYSPHAPSINNTPAGSAWRTRSGVVSSVAPRAALTRNTGQSRQFRDGTRIDPIVLRTNPNPRKENQRSTGKLPEAPLTQALLSLAAQPGHDNALRPTSTDSPSQPAEPAFPNNSQTDRVPAGQVAVIHYEQPGASTLALSVKCPLGRLEIHHLLRSTRPLNSQPTFGFQPPFQLSFQQPFQTGRVPDNQTTYGDIILEYFISDTATTPRILIAPPPDFDPTARFRSKRLVKLLLDHGPIQKFAMRIKRRRRITFWRMNGVPGAGQEARQHSLEEELKAKMGTRFRLGWEKWLKDEEAGEKTWKSTGSGTALGQELLNRGAGGNGSAGTGEAARLSPCRIGRHNPEEVADRVDLYTKAARVAGGGPAELAQACDARRREIELHRIKRMLGVEY
ncbi:hypothetical protein FRC01_005339 [Tulasnella sp. 417]|nr:hypothetical protein FRC01_005339 [Tulasnella sp. 417]